MGEGIVVREVKAGLGRSNATPRPSNASLAGAGPGFEGFGRGPPAALGRGLSDKIHVQYSMIRNLENVFRQKFRANAIEMFEKL